MNTIGHACNKTEVWSFRYCTVELNDVSVAEHAQHLQLQ